jgi:uncharacterized protein (TIGR02246 family)
MTKNSCIAAAFAIVVCGCGPSANTEPSLTTDADSLQEIAATLMEYKAAMSAMDWESVVGFYADDPRFYWIEDGSVKYESKDAVESAMRGMGTSLESIEMTVSDRKITLLSENTALVAATYVQRMAFEGGQEFSLAGAYTIAMERQGAAWKFLIGHSSTVKERTY